MNAPDFLVESIPNPVHGQDANDAQNPWLAVIFPLILSTLAGLFCYFAAGISLGLFLGGILVAGLITGPLVAAEMTWLGRSLAVAGIIHGIAGAWLFATIKADLDLGLWTASYLTLISMVFAMAGLTALLRRVGLGRIGSGALVTAMTLAWLTWPIWLSPALHGRRGEQVVSWLVPAHPIFAINGVLRPHFGAWWAEQGIAYNLTNLSDDIAYGVPDNVLKCVLLNAGIAVGGAGLSLIRKKERKREVETSGRY